MEDLAPIVLFVYNRPLHTQNILDSLVKNKLASETMLYVFSDSAKTCDQEKNVNKVRKIVSRVNGFKRIKTITKEKNEGLAESIINGVSEIVERYGKVIVLEDDLVCSQDFLLYMNQALDTYKDRPSIWSISGYSPHLKFPDNYKKQIYLSPRACSWGWATWSDRWMGIDWNVSDFDSLKKDRSIQKAFNQGGNDLYKMLDLQVLGKIDSWAIRWCYAQFKAKKYTVYPLQSKVINNGFAGNGTHNTGRDSRWNVKLSNIPISLPEQINMDPEIGDIFKRHYDLDLIGKVGYFLRKHGGYGALQKFKYLFRR